MNFLELHNKVLDRLRENRIVSSDIGNDPYVNSISAHINDAKDTVQNAWNWGVLRGEDTIAGTQGNEILELTGSGDTNYLINGILCVDTGLFLRQRETAYMAEAYANDANDPVGEAVPREFALYYNNSSTGDIQVRMNPRPEADYTFKVFRIQDRADLVNYDDVLLLPALPVYSLATALASRERGDLNGTPTSELFMLADAHLSDAIAMDSALYPEDTTWFVAENPAETNVRYNY